jgi:hypothetical protein
LYSCNDCLSVEVVVQSVDWNHRTDQGRQPNSLATRRFGKVPSHLVQEAVAGFVDELTAVRHMLDTRYDDVKSGRVEPVDGEEAFTRLRDKSQSRRSSG